MWGWLETAIEWMGKHKLATAGIAAGAGYLVVSKTASAQSTLPGASPGAKVLPNGGIASSIKVIPPPVTTNTVKTVLQVTTRDEGVYGSLNARATSDPNSPKVGYWPKNGLVELLSPDTGTGMVYVRGPGVGPNGETNLEAWAAKAYLQAAN